MSDMLLAVSTLAPLKTRSGILHRIQRAVCEVTGVYLIELKSERRHKWLVRARNVYYEVARRHARASMPRIGYYCGGRDHSTVFHGLQTVADNPDIYDPLIAHVVARLKAKGELEWLGDDEP